MKSLTLDQFGKIRWPETKSLAPALRAINGVEAFSLVEATALEFLRRRAVSDAAGRHANRSTVAEKTAPVRRLTVNRKPLRTQSSLAEASENRI